MSEVHKTIKVDEWEITAVDDNPGKLPISTFQSSLSTEKRAAYFPLDGKEVNTSTHVYILKGKGHTILVDTAFGKVFFNTLAALKVKNEDVDLILITHAHGDHISGLIKDEIVQFPKAKVLFSNAEKAAYIGNGGFGGVPDKVAAAYGARLETFDYGKEVVPGLKAIDLSGHTAGHTGFELTGNAGSRLVFAGDFVHATDLQFANPDEAFEWDEDKPKAIAARRRVMERAAGEKFLLAGAHILYPGIGHVEKVVGGEYKFIPIV